MNEINDPKDIAKHLFVFANKIECEAGEYCDLPIVPSFYKNPPDYEKKEMVEENERLL